MTLPRRTCSAETATWMVSPLYCRSSVSSVSPGFSSSVHGLGGPSWTAYGHNPRLLIAGALEQPQSKLCGCVSWNQCAARLPLFADRRACLCSISALNDPGIGVGGRS
jgi:hypothetical protein